MRLAAVGGAAAESRAPDAAALPASPPAPDSGGPDPLTRPGPAVPPAEAAIEAAGPAQDTARAPESVSPPDATPAPEGETAEEPPEPAGASPQERAARLKKRAAELESRARRIIEREARAAAEAAPAEVPAATEAPASPAPKAKAGGAAKAKPEPKPDHHPVPPVPMAGPARLERRHIVLGASFLAMVFLPLIVTAAYLFGWAQDQYASRVGFVLRNEETASASSMLSGILGVTGGSSSSDSDVLYRFIQSEDMVARVDARLDLHRIYSAHADSDPVFSLATDTSREEMLTYWNRMVKVFYDNGTGLIEVRVNAFAPEEAQAIASVILEESTATVNALSTIAREDATRYAREDLAMAETRLREARMAVAEFRSRTQMVDPAADVAGQMSLLGNLQGQLATAIIESDLLKQTGVRTEDPRSQQIARRIGVIEDRLREERAKLATTGSGSQAGDYVTAVGDFERLRVDQEFAEKAYLTSLAAYDAARAEAQRNSRYLATYVQPTLAETAQYPRRLLIISMAFIFLVLAWSVVGLVYYAIRDRR